MTRRPRPRAAAAAALALAVLWTSVLAPAAASALEAARSGAGSGASARAALDLPAVHSADSVAPDDVGSIRGRLLDDLNRDRAAAGLRAYLPDPALNGVAQTRVERLAASGIFSHATAGPPILAEVTAAGVPPLVVGETLGWSSGRGMTWALASIRGMWLASPEHRALVLSDRFNYVGIGIAVRGGQTYVAVSYVETQDRTAPSARVVSAWRIGTSIGFTWTASDPLLQSHAAGIRNVVVELRVDSGPWKRLRLAGLATSVVLRGRVPGHAYALRVRARDRAGNVSAWSPPRTVRVP